jgi:very-short-patch-repair endonuclease
MNLKHTARTLRKNMTEAERRLWWILRHRHLGWKFRRQVPLGPYILDFVSFEQRVVIEVDGEQHLDSREDAIRDSWLRQQGFKVLHFWNKDVLATPEGIMATIQAELSPPPQPSPAKGGG